MGFRFRKTIGLFGGLFRLNLSKTRGVSLSAGAGPARFNVGADGRTYTTLGLHGTGLSYRVQGHIPGTKVFRSPDRSAPEPVGDFQIDRSPAAAERERAMYAAVGIAPPDPAPE